MDDQTTKLLMKKVKKYRKWAESVFINPVYWKVNGKPYFMAGFLKNDKPAGTAYVTIGEDNREEAFEAQQKLALFADLSSSIFQIGEARLKVESAYYINPLNTAIAKEEGKVRQGRDAFAGLWDIQQKFNRLVKDFKHYYEHDVLAREHIIETDLAKVQETANRVNMYQYLTLTTLLSNNDEIRAFADFLESAKTEKQLERHQLDFVKGITENKDVMELSLAKLNMIVDEDLEKMEKLNYNYSAWKNKRIIDSQQKYVRYPK
ncbi:hypothetical protein [Planomicrobium sp. CPCC 101079]|uniref:hypothetical protein n=1 Tax=Planomicrobium sp. CPCC 101079 TaxID=2599618 RepID=UPI0011B788AC|nr:hypothetical protein [Planomicrobium sp. CPCC 101079]TWT01467.1 hypothetical protein FQV28_15440 [Planomicrobium sp. CPCC 101079]